MKRNPNRNPNEVRMHIILGKGSDGSRRRWSYNAMPNATLKDGTLTEKAYREFLERKAKEGQELECYLITKPAGVDEKFTEGQHYIIKMVDGKLKSKPVATKAPKTTSATKVEKAKKESKGGDTITLTKTALENIISEAVAKALKSAK